MMPPNSSSTSGLPVWATISIGMAFSSRFRSTRPRQLVRAVGRDHVVDDPFPGDLELAGEDVVFTTPEVVATLGGVSLFELAA